MIVPSYKNYLALLEKGPSSTFSQKIALFAIATFFTMFAVMSVIYTEYKKQDPVREQAAYFEMVSSGFISTKQSLEDLIVGFQVAGVKVKSTNNTQEATSSAIAGFNGSLSDIEKTQEKIKSVKNNINENRAHTLPVEPPSEMLAIHQQLVNYYEESESFLNSTYISLEFAKKMLVASGPEFYQPVLSEEKLWKDGNKEEIAKYYTNKKEGINRVLINLSKLNPPPDYQDYYQSQIKYLETLTKLSDDIIHTLEENDSQDPETPAQMEKAYQLLTTAKKDNALVAQQLQDARTRLFDPKRALEKAIAVRINQNSLEGKLSDLYTSLQSGNHSQKTWWDVVQGLVKNIRISAISDIFEKVKM